MLITGGHGTYTAGDQPFQRGGQAELFRVAGPARLVYKRYREPLTGAADLERLRKLVMIGRSVRHHEPGGSPESSVNWPIDLITGGGGVLGVVLPEIPHRFYRPDGTPRALDFLVFARADPPEASTRILVLIRVAEIFAWLDAHALIYGDFSGKNVVWTAQPSPAAYLIDADPIQSASAPAQRGVATPWWGDPRLTMGRISAQDQYSDWWGLALAIYRGLWLTPGALRPTAKGSWSKPADFPRGLAREVKALIERSLDAATPAPQRASPSEWVGALTTAFIKGNTFKTDQLALLNKAARANDPRLRVVAQAQKAPAPPRAAAPRPPAAPRERWLRRHAMRLAAVGVACISIAASVLTPRVANGSASCGTKVLPSIPPPQATPAAGIAGFHAAYYGQSGYVETCPGERVHMSVAFYNSGSRGWLRGSASETALIGTSAPDPGQDRVSLLGGDGTHGSVDTRWFRAERPAIQSTEYVGPGQVGWFFFDIQAPAAPGVYRLAVRPLIEGVTWMEDPGVQWQVTVR